jgi:hypothetical protein
MRTADVVVRSVILYGYYFINTYKYLHYFMRLALTISYGLRGSQFQHPVRIGNSHHLRDK